MNRKNCVSLIVALCVGCFALASGSLFAADPVEIELVNPNINYAGLGESLMNILMSPAAVGIGIGLSLWAIFAGLRFFKKGATKA